MVLPDVQLVRRRRLPAPARIFNSQHSVIWDKDELEPDMRWIKAGEVDHLVAHAVLIADP